MHYYINLNAFNIMKVNLAAWVISSTIANAFEYLNWEEVAETILFTRNFWQVLWLYEYQESVWTQELTQFESWPIHIHKWYSPQMTYRTLSAVLRRLERWCCEPWWQYFTEPEKSNDVIPTNTKWLAHYMHSSF